MKKQRRFKLLRGSILYLILLVYSFVLTQLLRNPVSAALFIFVLILPIVSLVHCLIGKSAIQIYVGAERSRTEKNAPLDYEIKIVNTTPLSYPFVEAVIAEPSEDAVKCTKKRFILSLVSFGSYSVKNTVRFRYRGYYEIGVDSLYISDLFRFFAIRADMRNYAAVTVVPRKMRIVGDRRTFFTDTPSPVMRRDVAADKNEQTDIREYVPGDSVRDIHWKLSSKTQDLMVKQYSSVEDRHVYVFCDLARCERAPEAPDSYDEYDELRRYVRSENKKEKKKNRIRMAAYESRAKIEERTRKIEELAEGGDAETAAFAKRRLEKRHARRMRAGMSERESETIRAIDELINSTKKHAAKKPERGAEAPAREEKNYKESKSETQSDLERILALAPLPDKSEDSARAFGGRIKINDAEEYDDLCLDAVVEMTLAEVLSELRCGNICTVVWFDESAPGGISSVTMSGVAGYEDAFAKLSTANSVPHESFVANLAHTVTESSNVTVKIVTSNLDPQSAALTASVPSKFGGAGTGCSVEAVIYSPSDRYEDEALRASYTDGVAADFRRHGLTVVSLSERTLGEGECVFAEVH